MDEKAVDEWDQFNKLCIGFSERDWNPVYRERIIMIYTITPTSNKHNYDENAWNFVRYDIIEFFGHLGTVEKSISGERIWSSEIRVIEL